MTIENRYTQTQQRTHSCTHMCVRPYRCIYVCMYTYKNTHIHTCPLHTRINTSPALMHSTKLFAMHSLLRRFPRHVGKWSIGQAIGGPKQSRQSERTNKQILPGGDGQWLLCFTSQRVYLKFHHTLLLEEFQGGSVFLFCSENSKKGMLFRF